MRVVVEIFLLFLLPTAAYLGYVYWAQGGRLTRGQFWDEAPMIWLAIAGLILVAIFLIGFGSPDGGRPDQIYVPTQYKDGKVEPGGFK